MSKAEDDGKETLAYRIPTAFNIGALCLSSLKHSPVGSKERHSVSEKCLREKCYI